MGLVEKSNITIIRRGMRYYRERRVLSISNNDENKYFGLIRGSKGMYYDVFIDINNPSNSTCTCPSRVICKHMLAFLFEVDLSSREQAKMMIDEYRHDKRIRKMNERKQRRDNQELINFLSYIFNGIDPYTGEKIPDDSFLNKPDALRKINAIILELKKDTVKSHTKTVKIEEEKEDYNLEEVIKPEGVYITQFLQTVNEIRTSHGDKKISAKKIGELLVNEGYVYFNENGIKVPTVKGEECGMISVYKELKGKSFYTIEYNMHAQKELVKLIKENF